MRTNRKKSRIISSMLILSLMISGIGIWGTIPTQAGDALVHKVNFENEKEETIKTINIEDGKSIPKSDIPDIDLKEDSKISLLGWKDKEESDENRNFYDFDEEVNDDINLIPVFEEQESGDDEKSIEDEQLDENDVITNTTIQKATREIIKPQAVSTDVGTFSELKAALGDATIDTVNVTADITDYDEALIIDKDITFTTAGSKKVLKIDTSDVRHFQITEDSKVSFENIILDGNNLGGGMIVDASKTLTLKGDGATIKNCVAKDGGAIYSVNGNVDVEDMVFESNNATGTEISTNSFDDDPSHTPAPGWGNGGGAIYLLRDNDNKSAKITLRGRTTFSNNTAEANGGAVFAATKKGNVEANYNSNTIVSVSDRTEFEYNSAKGNGGAIHSWFGSVDISNQASFVKNVSTNQNSNNKDQPPSNFGAGGGGAVYVKSTYYSGSTDYITLNISDRVLFQDNDANINGGAVFSVYTKVNITDSVQFINNKAGQNPTFGDTSSPSSTPAPGGGAIYHNSSNALADTLTIKDYVLFQKNAAGTSGATTKLSRGGAINIENGHAGIYGHVEFSNNVSNGAGGAVISMSREPLKIEGQVVLSGNKVTGGGGGGGAIYMSNSQYDPTLLITGSGSGVKVTDNTVTSTKDVHGGGIRGPRTNIKGEVLIDNNELQSGGTTFYGGGVYASYLNLGDKSVSGTVTITRNKSQLGGGVFATGQVTTDGKVVVGGSATGKNYASTHGGGIGMTSSQMTIAGDTIVSYNEAKNSGGGLYFGVSGTHNNFIRDNAKIENNKANIGGATYTASKNVKLSGNALVRHNTANNGGGLYSNGAGSYTVSSNAAIMVNTATNGGGVYLNSTGGLTVEENAKINENIASTNGGGIYTVQASTVLMKDNSILQGNVANGARSIFSSIRRGGGGIFANNANAILSFKDNVKVSINSAPKSDGGGINVNNTQTSRDKVTAEANVKFSSNSAIAYHHIKDEDKAAHDVAILITPKNFSAFDGHPYAYNNYDINYPNGSPIVPTYNVTYNGNGNTGGTVPIDSTDYEENDTVTVSTDAPIKTGHSFGGWISDYDSKTYNGDDVFTMPAIDVELKAVWNINTYKVKYLPGTSASVSSMPNPDNYDVTYGAIYTVKNSIPIRSGYSFTGWKYSENSSGYIGGGATFTMPDKNVTLTAQWSKNPVPDPTYSVKYYGNENTGGTVPVDSNKYKAGQTVTVKIGIPSRSGYDFTGWEADFNGKTYYSNDKFKMPAKNVKLTAKWKKKNDDKTYLVKYYGNGNTGGTVPADENKYSSGSTVTVKTQLPTRNGYKFNGWKADFNGKTYKGNDKFTMPAKNVNLTAIWTNQNTPVTPPEPPVSPPSLPDEPYETFGPTDSNADVVDEPSGGGYRTPEKSQGQKSLIDAIRDGNIPLGGFRLDGAWSLLSLIMCMFAFIASVVLILTMFRRRDKDEEDEEDEAYRREGYSQFNETDEEEEEEKQRKNRSRLLKGLAVIIGIVTIIVWLVLDDLTLPMVFINKWTPLVGLLFLIHLIVTIVQIIVRKKKSEDDDDEEEEKGGNYAYEY